MIEAKLYKASPDGHVDCGLCAHRCRIASGKRGICGVRENVNGVLNTLVYGRLIAENIDPVEKKPLFHFQPGSRTYSIATVGCNFRCLHCQNADISQMPKDQHKIIGEDVRAEEVVGEACATGCSSISYTYTEPTIFYEFAHDTAVIAKGAGLKNIFVTNGYMTKECLNEMRGLLDAANVDIKAFTDSFYRKVCGARLAPVLDSVAHMRSIGVWVELTTLLIPGMNDGEEELRGMAKWIASTDKTMPWHLSAFHPAYKLMEPASTPPETLIRAREIGMEEGLKYVYTGNLPGLKGESTYCPNCRGMLIERFGFVIKKNVIVDDRCPSCETIIDGVEL